MTYDSALILANCLDALEHRTLEQRALTLDDWATQHPDQRSMLIELAPLVQQLRSAPSVIPSLDFRADARVRLIARLPARHGPRTRFTGRPRWLIAHRLVVTRVLIVLAVLMALGTSVVAASAESLPNDPLYSIKIAIEQVRITFSPDRLARSELRLGFAAERLDEVQRLIERGRGGDAAGALGGFADQIQSAAALAAELPEGIERETLLSRVRVSIEQSNTILSTAETQLPPAVQPALKHAREALRLSPDKETHSPLPDPTKTPTPTATSTPRPARERSTVPPVVPTETITKVPVIRSTLPPTKHPTIWATLVPTRWRTYVPTQWLTAIPTHWPTLIATLRSTMHATFIPPTRPTRPPVATPHAWPTPNPTLLPMPIHTPGAMPTRFKPR